MWRSRLDTVHRLVSSSLVNPLAEAVAAASGREDRRATSLQVRGRLGTNPSTHLARLPGSDRTGRQFFSWQLRRHAT